jgi:aspartyl-tRNA(Asn)/glutamyl-tRNA(Gln) amidotransferase subunit A
VSHQIDQPIAKLACSLRDGTVSAQDLWEEAEESHKRHSKRLHAYIHWDADQASNQATAADAAFKAGHDLGPLQGIPGSIKDLFALHGYPTFAGSPKRLPAKWEKEGPVMRAYRRQGPVIVGKTHMVEFAFGGIGSNSHWGTPRNPWDSNQHRIPGGSSAGAGVSLREGSALIAFGSDTAGSVRIPASVTGCAGIKITHGRWSLDGIVPLSPSLDTPGFLTRTAADLAWCFYALDPAHNASPVPLPLPRRDVAGLRIGISGGFLWDNLSPGIGEVIEQTLKELEIKGARRVAFSLPELDGAATLFDKGGLAAPEFHAFLSNELPDWVDTLDIGVAARVSAAVDMPTYEYLNRIAQIKDLARSANLRMAGIDVLATPTVALTPPVLADIATPDAYAKANLATLRNTFPANFLNLCAITLPCGRDAAGMPVGLQLMAGAGQEEALLAVAIAVEDAIGTADDRIGRPNL